MTTQVTTEVGGHRFSIDVDTLASDMALTDAAIKALKPQAKRYFVTDDRGLSLEVYPTGGMAWRYRYRLNGKLEKVALGKYPALSLKAARLKRDELAATVAQGQSPAQQKQLRKRALATATTVRLRTT